jgi:hypothetical protein
MGEWKYNSTILDHVTRWRWVISFAPRFPLDTRLRGTQSRSERCEEEENDLPAVAFSYADWDISALYESKFYFESWFVNVAVGNLLV